MARSGLAFYDATYCLLLVMILQHLDCYLGIMTLLTFGALERGEYACMLSSRGLHFTLLHLLDELAFD